MQRQPQHPLPAKTAAQARSLVRAFDADLEIKGYAPLREDFRPWHERALSALAKAIS